VRSKVQKKQKLPNSKPTNLKLAFLALGILILLLIIGRFLTFLISLQKPISSEFQNQKKYSWNKESSYNLAFVSKAETQDPDISVVSIHPAGQKATILHLSSNIYTDVPKGYGKWRLGSVYALGNEENPPIGASLLKMTLTRLLALPIDGIVMLPNSTAFNSTEEVVESFRKNFIPDLFYLSKIESDLTKWEGLQLYGALSGIRADKIASLDFERSTITESKLLPDSSRVLGVNTVRLDLFIRDKLADQKIVEENMPIAIFNATNQTGLAQEVARFVTNLGGNVIIMQNLDTKEQKSNVVITSQTNTSDIQKSISYQRVAQLIAPHCLNNDCNTTNAKILSSRAVINIVVGEDFVSRWYNSEGEQ
jgi:hypothetical protein